MSVIPVKATEDGGLLIPYPGPAPKRWIEVEPLVFRETDGQETLVFREDDGGRITHLFLGRVPVMAFDRLALHETPAFSFTLVGACALLFLSAIILWPMGFVIRIRKGKDRGQAPSFPFARWLAWAMSTLLLVFLVGLAIILSDPNQIAYGVSPFFHALLVLPLLASALTLCALASAVWAWKRRYWRFVGRVYYTLVALAVVAMLWWLDYWNLLGFRY